MLSLKQICEQLYLREAEEEKSDSDGYIQQRDKCMSVYDELFKSLSKEQQKKLNTLDMEYFLLGGQWNKDGFCDGAEKGFKAAIRLLFDSMRDK